LTLGSHIESKNDEIIEILTTRIENLFINQADNVGNAIYNRLQANLKISKTGSVLSSHELATYHFITVTSQELKAKYSSHPLKAKVSECLMSFKTQTSELVTLKAMGSATIDEIDDVQPISTVLCDSLLKIFKLSEQTIMYVANTSENSYRTTIENVWTVKDRIYGEYDVEVNGFTDKSFRYRNCPVGGVFEDKTVGANIREPKYEAQALTEVKAFGEQFKLAVKIEPSCFMGILSNLQQFYLYYRIVSDAGVISWHRTDLIASTDIPSLTALFIEYFENMKQAMREVDVQAGVLMKPKGDIDSSSAYVTKTENRESQSDFSRSPAETKKAPRDLRDSSSRKNGATSTKKAVLSTLTESNLNARQVSEESKLRRLLVASMKNSLINENG
jgi:hypothetical protein